MGRGVVHQSVRAAVRADSRTNLRLVINPAQLVVTAECVFRLGLRSRAARGPCQQLGTFFYVDGVQYLAVLVAHAHSQ